MMLKLCDSHVVNGQYLAKLYINVSVLLGGFYLLGSGLMSLCPNQTQ